MIRGLVLLLLFLGGLAAALVSLGQVHHLRLAVPDRLPDWTGALADDAGLRRGWIDLPAEGRWPATRLFWAARAPARDGLRWDLSLRGEGVDLTGLLTLDYLGRSAVLTGGAGSVDLAALDLAPVPVQGILRVDALRGEAAGLRDNPVIVGALQAQIPALRIDGADFGSGPLTADLERDGTWQAELRLDGGVSPAVARLKGRLDQTLARLESSFDDGAALPPRMRGMLSAVAAPEGGGWRLALPVAVP